MHYDGSVQVSTDILAVRRYEKAQGDTSRMNTSSRPKKKVVRSMAGLLCASFRQTVMLEKRVRS